MTNTTPDLAALNSLRVKNGKAPLKSWKESKAKLETAWTQEYHKAVAGGIDQAKKEEQRVARLRQEQLEETARKAREQREAAAKELAEAEAKLPKPAPVKAKGAVDVKALQEALAKTTKTATKIPAAGTKPAQPAKAEAAPKAAKASTGSGSSEAGIAAERLGISAKAVRAKLRKLGHTAGHGLSADQIVKLMK